MQPRIEPFRRHHQRYENWFERHDAAYLSEPLAVRALLPWAGRGLEIGVGSARFAAPLGVEFGIDPAPAMRAEARRVLKPGGAPVWAQTLLRPLAEIVDVEPVRPGRGQGSFVVVRADRR